MALHTIHFQDKKERLVRRYKYKTETIGARTNPKLTLINCLIV